MSAPALRPERWRAVKASHAAAVAVAVAVAIIVGVGLGLHHHAATAHAKPIPIRIGVEFNTHATAIWVALSKHMFQKYGLDVVKVMKFRTGCELAAAFAHGQLDAAWACLAPIVKIIDKGAKIYIVEATHYYGYGCVGKPGIKSVEDLAKLKNPVIAVPGKGAQVVPLLLLAEKKYGFHAKLVYIKPPAILAAVEKGSVDAACIPEPLLSIAQAKGLPILFTSRQLWPDMPGSYLVVSKKLLEEHPEAVCRLAELTRAATRYAVEHPKEAAEIDSKVLGIPVKIVEMSLHRLELTNKLNLDQMQRLVNIMYENGVIKHKIDIRNYIVNLTELCGKNIGQ